MSTLGNAYAALKSIILLQERLDAVQRDVTRLGADLEGVNDYALSIDKRVIRIETMIEMSRPGAAPPRLEGS